MKCNLFIIFIIQLFFLCACKEETTLIVDVEKTLNFDAHNIDSLLYKRIEGVKFLALDANDESDIYEVDKMVIKNDLIFIGDFHAGKIVAYDMDGKIKFILYRKGVGPQEYLELKSFAVDDQNIYILDNFRHCMNIYDCYTGEFKSSKKMPFVAWDIEVLSDDHLIFAFVPLSGGALSKNQPLYKIFVTDKELHIINKFFKYEKEDCEFVGKTTYFTSIQNRVIFSSMASDDFTIFLGVDSIRRIAVSFENEIPSKYRTNKNKIFENSYDYIAQTPRYCADYIAFEFSVGDNLISYVYDESEDCFLANSDINSCSHFLHPVASFKNIFVSYLDNYSLYKELVDTGFERAAPKIESHLQNEGAVLVLYIMY